MTAAEIYTLRKLNKALNQQMVRAEKTAGTSRDLTKTPQYKRLKELAGKEGVKSKTGKIRFKENGLDKMSTAEVEKIKRISEKAATYKSPISGLKEAKKRFKKGGIALNEEQLLDILEAQKQSIWKELKEYYDSDTVIELINEVNGNTSKLNDLLDEYNAYLVSRGLPFDPDEYREILYTGRKPWKE